MARPAPPATSARCAGTGSLPSASAKHGAAARALGHLTEVGLRNRSTRELGINHRCGLLPATCPSANDTGASNRRNRADHPTHHQLPCWAHLRRATCLRGSTRPSGTSLAAALIAATARVGVPGWVASGVGPGVQLIRTLQVRGGADVIAGEPGASGGVEPATLRVAEAEGVFEAVASEAGFTGTQPWQPTV